MPSKHAAIGHKLLSNFNLKNHRSKLNQIITSTGQVSHSPIKSYLLMKRVEPIPNLRGQARLKNMRETKGWLLSQLNLVHTLLQSYSKRLLLMWAYFFTWVDKLILT